MPASTRQFRSLVAVLLFGAAGCDRHSAETTAPTAAAPTAAAAAPVTPVPAATPAPAAVVDATPVGYDERVRSTFYHAHAKHGEPGTDTRRSATGVPLLPATATQVGVCAVDPSAIPYGSQVIVPTAGGPRYYVAADTGGSVKHERASRGTAPVIDFYSRSQVGDEYQTVTIIPYAGTVPFNHLTAAEKRTCFDPARFAARQPTP